MRKAILLILILASVLLGCNLFTRTTTSPQTTQVVTTSETTLPTATGEPVAVVYTANAESAVITPSKQAPYHVGDFLTLTAGTVSGYNFLHWYDLDQEMIVGDLQEVNLLLARNFRLEAVYVPETEIRLSLYSNSSQVTSLFEQSGNYPIGNSITLMAPDVSGERFGYWYDAKTEQVISTANPYAFIPDGSMYLVAVYEALQGPQGIYTTDFETAVKSSYLINTITIEDEPWILADTLIGNLENDQKDGDKSVRIRNGYLESDFTMTGLSSVSFNYGRYLGDAASNIVVSVSEDKTNWIEMDTLLADTWQEYTFNFDESWYLENDLALDSDLYFRIMSMNDLRVNIDNIAVTGYHYSQMAMPEIFSDVSELTFPDNSDRVSITFALGHKLYYSYGETWSNSYCQAEDVELGNVPCKVYGNVDTANPGVYDVTYYVIDQDGNYASETMTYVVLKDATYLEVDYVGYYDGIEGLYGEDLLEALRIIIQTGVNIQTYDDARQILADSDVDPDDSDSVLTIYTQESVPRVWDAESWHREHVWPNSRLGVPRVSGTDRSIASDLHNLRAIVPSVNSSRSNKIFALETASDTYFPGEDIGDVARILFYMLVMYPQLSMTDEVLPNDPETNYTPEGAKMAMWSLMFDWNDEDPVSAFEQDRNDVIYSYQNNLNPFIDYPYLADLIWFADPAVNLPGD